MKNNYKNLFNLKGYEVFVVGGCGLIGSQIVKALDQYGASIKVFDLDIKNKINTRSTKYVKFNCSDEKNIKNFFLNYIKKTSAQMYLLMPLIRLQVIGKKIHLKMSNSILTKKI